MNQELFAQPIANISITCLSLWQPWASALVTPHKDIPDRAVKQFETRSWDKQIRGRILIHAAKKIIAPSEYIPQELAVRTAFLSDMDYVKSKMQAGTCPYGAIIGSVFVERVITSNDFIVSGPAFSSTPINEWGWGDWRPGRFGWQCAKPVLFDELIPFKGQQGPWKVPLSTIPEKYHQHFNKK